MCFLAGLRHIEQDLASKVLVCTAVAIQFIELERFVSLCLKQEANLQPVLLLMPESAHA